MAAQAGDTVDMATTSRYAGVLGGAAYRIEVPANWNGELVMYAHGYSGEGNQLPPTTSVIRRHLIQNGYAWAASSYSKNSYDVRAGVDGEALVQLLGRDRLRIADGLGQSDAVFAGYFLAEGVVWHRDPMPVEYGAQYLHGVGLLSGAPCAQRRE